MLYSDINFFFIFVRENYIKVYNCYYQYNSILMKLEHKHLIVRAEVNNCPKKGDLHIVLNWMNHLIKLIDMKLLQGPTISYVDQKGNRGTTCMALIETSHIVLHIWDEFEPGLFQLDLYSCKDVDINIVINNLQESFDIKKLEYKFLDRLNNLTLVEQS
ncbi:MAG: S-adenosylmethionine decarboxylase [Gammaproteobacteria bacterium]|nr:S-adenosylmethionine decarboxylase [Gammaproteobacteria bacterium]